VARISNICLTTIFGRRRAKIKAFYSWEERPNDYNAYTISWTIEVMGLDLLSFYDLWTSRLGIPDNGVYSKEVQQLI